MSITTTLDMSHEPTGSRIRKRHGVTDVTETPWEQIDFNHPAITVSATSYEKVGFSETKFDSVSIHLHSTSYAGAEIRTRVDGTNYVVVKLGKHRDVFVPIEVAEAIADVVSMIGEDEAVAS